MYAPSNSQPPALVRLVNVLGRGLSRIGLSSSFEADRFLRQALGERTTAALGDPNPSEPLRTLCRSINNENDLSPLGRVSVRRYLRDVLHFRLGMDEWRRRRPDLIERPIERPLIISGLPRTGTTLLQQLLSLDSRAGAIRLWELLSASRRSPSKPPPTKPDWILRAVLHALNLFTPGLRQVHPLMPMRFEECTMLLMNSFVSPAFQLIAPLREYTQWLFEQADDVIVDSYRLHRFQLQLLGEGKQFEHWVLKAPTHIFALKELLTVYPTAQIVLTERTPSEALASACSLFYVVRRIFCNQLDPRKIGPEIGELLGRSIERSAAACESFADRIFVVRYRDLVDRPAFAVRNLYERLGRTPPPTLDADVAQWLRENPQNKFGIHRYSPEEFGLDCAAWQKRFGAAYEALYGRDAAAAIGSSVVR